MTTTQPDREAAAATAGRASAGIPVDRPETTPRSQADQMDTIGQTDPIDQTDAIDLTDSVDQTRLTDTAPAVPQARDAGGDGGLPARDMTAVMPVDEDASDEGSADGTREDDTREEEGEDRETKAEDPPADERGDDGAASGRGAAARPYPAAGPERPADDATLARAGLSALTHAPPGVRPLEDGAPRRVGSFTILARLGTGSMGRVYLGRAPDGRLAAVKLVRPDLAEEPEFRERFRHEVSAAGQVHGPGIAEVLGADSDADQPWLATAYVDGPSLRQAVASQGPMSPDRLGPLAAGIARALCAIHDAGLVHRDLKPANVLLGGDGPRVIDFGIARSTDSTHVTATGLVVGTPAFMAPEQALGAEVTSAADMFALGATLVFAASGTTPFGRGTPSAVLWRVIHAVPDLSSIDDENLRVLVSRCLAKDPAKRPRAEEVEAHVTGVGRLAAAPESWLVHGPGSRAERRGAPAAARSAAAASPLGAPLPDAGGGASAAVQAAALAGAAPPGAGAADAARGVPRATHRRPRPVSIITSLAVAAAAGIALAVVGMVSSPSDGATPSGPAPHQSQTTGGSPAPLLGGGGPSSSASSVVDETTRLPSHSVSATPSATVSVSPTAANKVTTTATPTAVVTPRPSNIPTPTASAGQPTPTMSVPVVSPTLPTGGTPPTGGSPAPTGTP